MRRRLFLVAAAASGAVALPSLGASQEDAQGDFARLVPPHTILFAELDRPGERVATLLAELGLLQEGGAAAGMGIHPALVRSLLGIRGAAVAITGVDLDGGPPSGVLLLDPGDVDLLRGSIETFLPAVGVPASPVHGCATWSVEGELFVTLAGDLVVASRDTQEIEGVVRRMRGEERSSLATVESLAGALGGRGEDLVYLCVNAAPVRSMALAALREEARQDAELSMVLGLLDVESFEALTGRIRVGDDGIDVDVALELAEDHASVAFDFLRMPHVERRTLELVPAGAAFFLATCLNDPAEPTARTSGDGVSAMDVGRELFGNIVDVAVFGLPREGEGASPIPDVAVALRVNDPARSRALWDLGMGLVSHGTSGQPPQTVDVAGVPAERFTIEGVPVYLATRGDRLCFSPSESALARALGTRADSSIERDVALVSTFDEMPAGCTLAIGASPSRLAELARPFLPEHEAREVAKVGSMLEGSSVSLSVEHTDTRLGLHLRLRGLPDLSGVAETLIARRRGAAATYARASDEGR